MVFLHDDLSYSDYSQRFSEKLGFPDLQYQFSLFYSSGGGGSPYTALESYNGTYILINNLFPDSEKFYDVPVPAKFMPRDLANMSDVLIFENNLNKDITLNIHEAGGTITFIGGVKLYKLIYPCDKPLAVDTKNNIFYIKHLKYPSKVFNDETRDVTSLVDDIDKDYEYYMARDGMLNIFYDGGGYKYLLVRYRDPYIKSAINVMVLHRDGDIDYIGVLWARKVNYANSLVKLPDNIRKGDLIILKWTGTFKISAVGYAEVGKVKMSEVDLTSIKFNGEDLRLGGNKYIVLRLGDGVTFRFNSSDSGIYAFYVKGFVISRDWIKSEGYVKEISINGILIKIPIPGLKPDQTMIKIDKLVIKYE